ncbi:MAG: hypothetical protein NWE96_00115 [Candidatus Bathyarchaeota archaeon]|nr:hypothetical protein [Candidatus Bathyarchaeota archaeon]
MNKALLLAFVVFTGAVLLRLYPALISGQPFSTDGWSSIRNAELLIQNTPVSLANTNLFDGYNNYWPAISLYGAVFAQVTALAPVDAMAFGVPLASALAVPLFFVLVRRLTENDSVALIASALLATAYPFVMSSAGATKEAFAFPLSLLLILIFIQKPNWKWTALFSVVCLALLLSHHLAAALTFAALIFLAFAFFFCGKACWGGSIKQAVGLLSIFFAVTVAYYAFFALQGLPLSMSESDVLTINAYQIVGLSLAIFAVGKAKLFSRKALTISYVASVALAFGFMLFLTRKALLPTAPTLPLHYALYMIPYLIVAPLLVFGLKGLRESRNLFLLPVFWFVTIAAFECYAVFGGSAAGLMLAYRTLNFLVLPIFIITGLILWKFYQSRQRMRGGRFWAAGVAVVVLAAASLGVYTMYAAVSMQEQYLGYFWLYRAPETSSAQWIAAHAPNVTVAGDMKVSYLIKGYHDLSMDVFGGLKYLQSDGAKPALLYVYPEMTTNGYVVYTGLTASLPENWTAKAEDLNHVYQNNMVNLYAK